MSSHSMILVATAALVLINTPRDSAGEVSTRECIRFGEPTPSSRIIIPGSTSQALVSLDFEVTSDSDAIFHVAFINQDSATPSRSRSRYSLLIDGTTSYHLLAPQLFFARTPQNTDGTIHQRWFLAGIPAGEHTATIGVENTETHDIEISGAWIGVLFIDASEGGAGQSSISTQSVGADWTTIGSFTAPSIADRHLIISGYARVSSTVPVEFRFRGNGNVLKTFFFDPEKRR